MAGLKQMLSLFGYPQTTLRLASACVAIMAAMVGDRLMGPAHAQTAGERPKVMIVLDASGSMRAKMDDRARMDIAKDVANLLVH